MTNEKWIQYLTCTKEKNYNVEHLKSLKDNSNQLVYQYVMRSINLLNQKKLSEKNDYYVREALKWMEVAKTGSPDDRRIWKKKKYDLFVHHVGSSQIYQEEKNYDEVVRVLVKTHGLIGQYIRGEVKLDGNKELYELILKGLISKDDLREVLVVFNECLISAASEDVYLRIQDEVNLTIERIVNGDFHHEFDLVERIHRLNGSISQAERDVLIEILQDEELKLKLENLFDQVGFWYYEITIGCFSIMEQIKILALCAMNCSNIHDITFEKIMKTIYLDYHGKREINLFKKRIVEEYLKHIEISDILQNHLKSSPHLCFVFTRMKNTMLFDFRFSNQAKKLIEFCEVATNSETIYKKAIYLLYDLFGFRKDEYDRFYNEIDYLNTMNASMKNKIQLLDYIRGINIIDVGPGGGALMDLMEERNPSYNIYGIDISSNVIDTLSERKEREHRCWNLIKGDALSLDQYFEKGSIDTIIFSSIIHELYSYIVFEGKKFNIHTVEKALKSAYSILPVHGRIIIRDGIKSEPENTVRMIRFKNIEDIKILERYCNDFKGRKITYEVIDQNTVKMLVNDAMEFLYTYTWGEDSYPMEVQEQFGYCTPTEYLNLIKKNLPNSKIITCNAFLQEGYEKNLLPKISIYDENMNPVKLPNSTCILVIEKNK